MTMTVTQSVITIAAVVLGTMTTRFLPFLVFPEGREPPAFIRYLGTVLPYAVIGLLLVYCLKDAVFTSYHALPELIAITVTAALQRWKRNMLLRRHGALYAARADLLCMKNEAMRSALSHFFFCSSILAPAQSRKTPNGLRNTVMSTEVAAHAAASAASVPSGIAARITSRSR